MVGPGIEQKVFSCLSGRKVKKRTIIVGLKSDNSSRELLLNLLAVFTKEGDNVIAIHVNETFNTFDPSTFHIHEDLCKSKQVDFLVKVCIGSFYIQELSCQVRLNCATILALGCSPSGPEESLVQTCLKLLPPTCSLLVVDNGGRIILQKQGTSQQGSSYRLLGSSSLYSIEKSYFHQEQTKTHNLQKSLTGPSTSASSLVEQMAGTRMYPINNTVQVPDYLQKMMFQQSLLTGGKKSCKLFTFQQLKSATNDFSSEMVIGEGGNSEVYAAILQDGRAAAVKVMKNIDSAEEDLLSEVKILSCIQHENIVELIGYAKSKDIHAIVYNLLQGSLKKNLIGLKWRERMGIAIGVAKALDYLHSLEHPVIHRDVKSSNILLSDDCQPQLSDFGAAIVHDQSLQNLANITPLSIAGTFGYLAPEYVMYGQVDEKVDVYSYGVVLLELITGKEAIQVNQAIHESLVLRARSYLYSDLCDSLIDPNLDKDYRNEEMEIMILAARLCLVHSSSMRPTMKMILKLFEDQEYLLQMRKEKDDIINWICSKDEVYLFMRQDDSSTSGSTDGMYD